MDREGVEMDDEVEGKVGMEKKMENVTATTGVEVADGKKVKRKKKILKCRN